jgi:hypothetical protein
MVEKQPENIPPDEPLRKILQGWSIGSPGPGLEARLRNSFRERPGRTVWGRFFASTVRVPVPLLAALVLACAIFLGLALRRQPLPPASAGPSEGRGSTARASLVGFEPVLEPKLIVLEQGEEP